jgi:hypothetical protein
MKGRVVKRRRAVRRIRATLSTGSSEIGIPDGFTRKERELKSKYPEFSDLITAGIAREREKGKMGLLPDLDGIEDEIRRLRKRPKYKSSKSRSKY